ncbi:MAG: PhzF family phenazine biosynthesis protein [Gammaproteobacteria bacterium]|nr:PhzF family phenazine biosynthesis protein [Gammaproteobacteria bacterium]
MVEISCLQIDAFTDRPFSGNPAAVCLLDHEPDSKWMQAVAAEMNLSETAFVRPLNEGFELRWFTPTIEVELCGHATLASAHALWTEGVVPGDEPIRFYTESGVLTCMRRGDLIELDFPATPIESTDAADELCQALGVTALFVGQSKYDNLVLVESEQILRAVQPDFSRLRKIPMRGVAVTSLSGDPRFDFVSRFFAPAAGVEEDPVTGSAHCCLGPFWSERLGKVDMTAFQASARGGVVRVQVSGERVHLGGQAVTIFRGVLLDDTVKEP